MRRVTTGIKFAAWRCGTFGVEAAATGRRLMPAGRSGSSGDPFDRTQFSRQLLAGDLGVIVRLHVDEEHVG